MEERIIDKEEARKIKIRRTAEGDDAVDALAPEGEELPEEEVILELPEAEEEYDEDLVGLTPSQLKEELERRKKEEERARAEHKRLLKDADEQFAAGRYEKAVPLYRQAMIYENDDGYAEERLWASATENYTSYERLLGEGATEEFVYADEACRKRVFKALGEQIREERDTLKAEADPLRETVETGMGTRRDAFRANRKYYLVRFGIAFFAFILLGIACAISANYIVAVKGASALIATIVFGALTLVALGVVFFFSRGLYLANRLCRMNERYSSTEDGARLESLDKRIARLELLLSEPEYEVIEEVEDEEE